jgi:acylphosphatase
MQAESSERAGARVVVRGKVQGVWFRDSCRRQAEQLGLAGWVRNLPDGSVEAVFEGPSGAVQRGVEWCRRGPSGAVVTSTEVSPQAVSGLYGFEIR